MEQMQRALEQAKAGHGQIVGVMGEPGLGKSRLFYEFKLTLSERLSGAGSLLRLARQSLALSAGDRTAQELLSRFSSQDDERTRREKVTGKVLDAGSQLGRHVALSVCLAGH